MAQGADALCLRVQLTRDRHPLVFGAARLEDATDGRGRIQDHTVRELKRRSEEHTSELQSPC